MGKEYILKKKKKAETKWKSILRKTQALKRQLYSRCGYCELSTTCADCPLSGNVCGPRKGMTDSLYGNIAYRIRELEHDVESFNLAIKRDIKKTNDSK